MRQENITYTDYNGVERTETFLFNLTQAEIMEMELGTTGGLSEMITKVVAEKDAPAIMQLFKDLVLRSYGEKSADGKRFIKSEELRTEFSQTEAYSQLFMTLATDSKRASDFVNGIVPGDAVAKAEAKKNLAKVAK